MSVLVHRILSNLMRVRDKTSIFRERELPRKPVPLSPRWVGSKRQADHNDELEHWDGGFDPSYED